MRSIARNCAFGAVGILALFLYGSCATDNSYAKERDYRNVKAGDSMENADYDEESNEFSSADSGSDKGVSNKKAGAGDEVDSSYKKGKFFQVGKASWYGREFNGRKTASGERFDMNGLTAAHKTLPFGTMVKVKNFENGKIITVRVNDRGPYRGNRIIDLSYGAAKKIGMIKGGETQVGLQIVNKGGGEEIERENDGDIEAVSDDTSHEDSSPSGGYAIQAGAFYSKRNADQLKVRIEGMTNKPVTIINDGDMYKVRIEGLGSKSDVNRLKRTLSDEDIPSYLVK
ncbi:MAG: septal ring lytic transglycosylase RlpA family protein [Spirochaetes bacterium]|nr:septal ring lytic transglycosylase RlpA family protein [Spirochaetota bacterium]